jgi:hypothetical protein
VELTCNADVVSFESFKRFWGLTRDFWAENGKRKMWGEAMAIKSVASKGSVADVVKISEVWRER